MGSKVAESLAAHFYSIDALMAASVEALQEIAGIGEVLARSVVGFLSLGHNRELIARLRERGVRLADVAMHEERPAPLSGLTFVITGTLPTLSREAATALISEQGGKVTGSVSGNTNYLVVGDKPGGSKYDRARSLGVSMISEEELRALIGGSSEGAAGPRPPAGGQLGLGI